MQFIIIARDHTDAEALNRRLAARTAHLDYSDAAFLRGEQIMGAAMLNDNDTMCGSVMIVDFPDRDALDLWLKVEPYVTGKVWERLEIIPCRIGPCFLKTLQKAV